MPLPFLLSTTSKFRCAISHSCTSAFKQNCENFSTSSFHTCSQPLVFLTPFIGLTLLVHSPPADVFTRSLGYNSGFHNCPLLFPTGAHRDGYHFEAQYPCEEHGVVTLKHFWAIIINLISIVMLNDFFLNFPNLSTTLSFEQSSFFL